MWSCRWRKAVTNPRAEFRKHIDCAENLSSKERESVLRVGDAAIDGFGFVALWEAGSANRTPHVSRSFQYSLSS